MTQLRNVHDCLTHRHPVLQATKLRRIHMIHLVKPKTLQRVKALRRKLDLTLIRKSVPLRRSQMEVDRALDKANKTLHHLFYSPKQQTSETTAPVLTADAILSARVMDGDVVYGKPPPECQPETLDFSKRTSIWQLQTNLYGLKSSPSTLAGPSGADPQEVRLRPEHA